MKKVITYFIIFSFPFFAIGQQKADSIPKRNTLYLEAFGQGIVYSLSYDRLLRINKQTKTSFSVGIIPFYFPTWYYTLFGVPISYNLLLGKKKNYLELGIGLTLSRIHIKSFEGVYYNSAGIYVYDGVFTSHQTNYISYLTSKIGYRFQRENGGFFYRVTFSPATSFINRIGTVSGKGPYATDPYYQYFENGKVGTPIYTRRFLPWGGVSIGYTFKK